MESQTLEQGNERETPKLETRAAEPVRTVVAPKPKNSSRKLIILIAVVALAAVGVYLWVHSLNRVSTDDAQVDGHIIPVSSKIYGKMPNLCFDCK